MIGIYREVPTLVWKEERGNLVAYLGSNRMLEIDSKNRILFESITTKPYNSKEAAIKVAESMLITQE